MFGLLVLVALGAILFFVVPPIIPANYRNAFTTNLPRVFGALLILFAIASTSYVNIDDGKFAQMFRKYGGGALEGGKIVAVDGENGPQARVLRPGFHKEFLLNVLYDVSSNHSEHEVKPGNVGVLTAKDGSPLRAGQTFADPFPPKLGLNMLDAETFMNNGGQRGPQLSVLPPGRYVLNEYLWQIEDKPAKLVDTGFVGVVKSNVWAPVDFGVLKSEKPDNCDVIQSKDTSAGRIQAPIVPVGCVGVWRDAVPPGMIYINPDAYTIIPIDTRAQVWTYAGGYNRCEISLKVDSKGDITQDRTCKEVVESKDNADRAVYVKMEGWDVPLELRVVAQVSPSEAACVVAGVGSLKEVEDRVLTPSIRAITRDVAGGTYEVTEPRVDENSKPILDKDGKPTFVTVNRPSKVLDLINQRPLIEGEVERRIRPEAEKSCVTIREVRLGEPAIPPELLVAVRREQLATQLAKAHIQEKLAQDQRVASEKSRATANQQDSLVTAEIAVQRSTQLALAAKNEGDGERDKLKAIAEGQKAQLEVLGADNTVALRRYELAMDRVFSFANAHPEVLAAALANANKFVPNSMTIVNSGGSGSNLLGMLEGVLGNQLSNAGPTPLVTAPRANAGH